MRMCVNIQKVVVYFGVVILLMVFTQCILLLKRFISRPASIKKTTKSFPSLHMLCSESCTSDLA